MSRSAPEIELATAQPLFEVQSKEQSNEPWFRSILGLFLMLMAQVLNSLSLAEAKYLYRSNSSLTAFEVLAFSGAVRVVLN